MADSSNDHKIHSKKSLNTNNSNGPLISETLGVRTYQDDKDFDEAFKNLLRPIELISKRNHYEPLQYDLLKELDSYLIHLRLSDNDSSVFVEAALMIQNVIFIYQKRVDQYIEIMTKLIGKFRAYRINTKDNVDGENDENGKKKKRKEKRVDFYSSFEPINNQIFSTLKNYDCKTINLGKKQPLPKIVLNANIKVDNKYNKILPYICVGNGENIGKKYDFMLNYPLNRDLAVNEEFDCTTIEDENSTPLNYQKSTDPLPTNLMDVDEINSDDILPSTPDPVIFDQTVTDEVCVANAMTPNPENILNVSKIPPTIDDDAWATVTSPKDNIYVDIPIVKQKIHKKEDNNTIWLPAYTIGELGCQLLRLKSGMSVDPVFRELIHKAQEVQRLEISKMRMKCKDKEKQLFQCYDEEMDEKLKTGEVPGFIGFDSPISDDDINYNVEEQEPLDDNEGNRNNFETYQKNAMDMKKHEQNQLDIMNEQLEMRKRVQSWHDNLRPILKEEEKRIEFDIHQYGTQVLDCFETLGEQKSFKDLVGGLEQEEVARYFLSTLMMANTYNLKITKSIDDSDEMKIEILKKERHHEELQVNIGNQVNQDLH